MNPVAPHPLHLVAVLDRASVIRVMLVSDDGQPVRRLLQSGNGPDLVDVVIEACDAAEACAAGARAADRRPDVILVDLACCGLAALAPIAAAARAPVVALVDDGDPSSRARVVRAGARGVVQSDDAPDTVRKALRKVRDGELWLDRASTAQLLDGLLGAAERRLPEGRIANLTSRESDIVRALVRDEGPSGRELAQTLRIGEQTLRNHFSSIYRKLGIASRAGLVAYAARERFVPAGKVSEAGRAKMPGREDTPPDREVARVCAHVLLTHTP